MKGVFLSMALECASGLALAQGADDPMAALRSCAALEPAARLECLDRLSRSIGPTETPARGSDNWVVSQMSSPVNYAPIVTATTYARGGSGNALTQLSIACRSGRTELIVSGSGLPGAATEFTATYRVDEGQPRQVPAVYLAAGSGAALKGDIVQLLSSLPDDGDLDIRLLPRPGTVLEGRFSLAGLKPVREKIAAACRWPSAVRQANP